MAKTKNISIPAPNVGRIEVTIQGKTPLLQNPWTERAMDALNKTAAKGKKELPSQEQEFQEKLEALQMQNGKKDADPVYGFTKEAITHGMASAAYRLGEFKMTEIRAAVSVATPDDRIPIDSPDPEIDLKPTNLAGRGSVKIAVRPRFWPWSATFVLEFDRGVLNEEQVIRILNDMGRGIGLGAFRPENNGTYGTFEVVSAVIMERSK